MDDSTDSVLQVTTPISSDTLKDALLNLGGNIRNLPDLKKETVAVPIGKGWGNDII